MGMSIGGIGRLRLTGLGAIAGLCLAGCYAGQDVVLKQLLEPTPSYGLQATSEADFVHLMRSALAQGGGAAIAGIDFIVPTAVPTPPIAGVIAATDATAVSVGAMGDAVSGTTPQEAGVDEADLIKSDGTQVFSLDGMRAWNGSDVVGTLGLPAKPDAVNLTNAPSVLRRQRFVDDGGAPRLADGGTYAVPFGESIRATGLYLDAERQQIAALGEQVYGWSPFAAWFNPYPWGQGATELSIIDVRDSNMRQKRLLRFGARQIGSRRVGSTLYLLLRSSPTVVGLRTVYSGMPAEQVSAVTADNQRILDGVSPSQLLPSLKVDGVDMPLVRAEDCLVQGENSARTADVVTLVAIDLAAGTHRHQARCFVGGTEAFYMSDAALYLATTRYAYSMAPSGPQYASGTRTDLHKFSLEGLTMNYRGSGSVAGHLGFAQDRKSFRMGEYQGFLRVVTEQDAVVAAASTSTAVQGASPMRLTVLKDLVDRLVVTGELPNDKRPQSLGKPGEQLYASRFLGARGYVVTYRKIDPLYVLDLSNPFDPRIAGELNVTGYSDYLFPVSESLLLGVGKETIPDASGGRGDGLFDWYQGVKVSLFDVGDPANPRELAKTVIGRRGTQAPVLTDHHAIALQFGGDRVRVALPVRVNESREVSVYGQTSYTGQPWEYFSPTRIELQRFEVNLAARTLTQRAAMVEPGAYLWRDIGMDRALLFREQTHWYQGGPWQSAAW